MQRSAFSLFLRYFLGSAALVVLAIGAARMLIADDPVSKAAITKLDERIETARQIRRALATPVPPPDPLPPITAKPARAAKAKPAEDSQTQKSFSPDAQDSMARGERRSPTTDGYSRPSGTGGW